MDRRRAELFSRVADAMETAARLAGRHADRLSWAGNDAAAATERQAAERARSAARRALSLSREAGRCAAPATTTRRSSRARTLFTGSVVGARTSRPRSAQLRPRTLDQNLR